MNLKSYQDSMDFREKWGVLKGFTIRFSLNGPDHLYNPDSTSNPVDYYPICVQGHTSVPFPLWFRDEGLKKFYKKDTSGNDHITWLPDYPELNLCPTCARYDLMIRLAE